MEAKNKSWKVNAVQERNLYRRNKYIYNKYILNRFSEENYEEKVIDLERRLLIAQAISLEKLQVPLFLNKIYYFDEHVYFPYLSDLIRVKYSPTILPTHEFQRTKYTHKAFLNYYEELIIKIYHLSEEDVKKAYPFYLNKLIESNDVLEEKPKIMKYRKKARRLDYRERESVGRSVARFFFVLIGLFVMLPLTLLALLITMSDISFYGRENLFQGMFFLFIFLIPLPFYLLGRRKRGKIGKFEKEHFSKI